MPLQPWDYFYSGFIVRAVSWEEGDRGSVSPSDKEQSDALSYLKSVLITKQPNSSWPTMQIQMP